MKKGKQQLAYMLDSSDIVQVCEEGRSQKYTPIIILILSPSQNFAPCYNMFTF